MVNGWSFVRSDHSYVRLQVSESKMPKSEFTIIFWLKVIKPFEEYDDSVVSYATSGNANQLLVFVDGEKDAFVLWLNNRSGDSISLPSDYKNSWAQYSLTWQSSTGFAKLYINGTFHGNSSIAKDTTITGGGTFILGQDQDKVLGGFDITDSLNGQLRNFHLFSTALNHSVIQEIYRGYGRCGDVVGCGRSDFTIVGNNVQDAIPDDIETNYCNDYTGYADRNLPGDASKITSISANSTTSLLPAACQALCSVYLTCTSVGYYKTGSHTFCVPSNTTPPLEGGDRCPTDSTPCGTYMRACQTNITTQSNTPTSTTATEPTGTTSTSTTATSTSASTSTATSSPTTTNPNTTDYTDPCAQNPCQYGGTCHDMVSSYKCECRAGFTGTDCEEIWTWIVSSILLAVGLLGIAALIGYYFYYRKQEEEVRCKISNKMDAACDKFHQVHEKAKEGLVVATKMHQQAHGITQFMDQTFLNVGANEGATKSRSSSMYTNSATSYSGDESDEVSGNQIQVGDDQIQTGNDQIQVIDDQIRTGDYQIQVGNDQIRTGNDQIPLENVPIKGRRKRRII